MIKNWKKEKNFDFLIFFYIFIYCIAEFQDLSMEKKIHNNMISTLCVETMGSEFNVTT